MAWTTAAPSTVFFSRQDALDPRLGEWSKSNEVQDLSSLDTVTTPSWVILGYPDDEGIHLNGGRPGAKEAPDLIRTFFYKMTPSLLNPTKKSLVDLGNLETSIPLGDRHQRGRQLIHKSLSLGHKTLSLGGGHDYGYADTAGFLDFALTLKERPVVINIDAHLDVRPSDKGFHSGTPFHRLLTDYAGKFDFIEIGLQNQCNSAEHLKWAQNQGAKTFLLEDIRSVGLMNLLDPVLSQLRGRPCFLSVDIDAFTSAEAPGCSQSWPSGLNYQEFSPFLRKLLETLNVLGLGIYEVSPPLDTDRQTSKLAALILHQTVFHSKI